MTLTDYIDYIKLELTGGVLELELTDEMIGKIVNSALKELQRYIDETKFITVPFASCIDMKGFKCSSITHIYRTEGYAGDATSGMTGSDVDPAYAQMWMMFSGGSSMYNLNQYVMNYLSYNTLLQMKNTLSTDLAFKYNKIEEKLYINSAFDSPKSITIEYIPIFENVEQITSDYWIDILKKLSCALVKRILGRIRTRYTSSSSLWQQDGNTLLEEGNTEINNIRETLRVNDSTFYPVD